MELDFDKIKRIRKIRSVKSDLSKEENILIKPILSDKKLIPLIYKTFTNIICKKSDEGISTVMQRKKFIFIILYLTLHPLWQAIRWLPGCVTSYPMY